MNHQTISGSRAVRRALSLLLALCLAVSLIPALPRAAAAAPPGDDAGATPDAGSDDVAKSSLDKLVDWGVLRGYTDGGLHPELGLKRSEFVAMVNRAYGYTQGGPTPFTDVAPGAWYEDDIGIAYNTGYFKGTTVTTAAPEDTLTRETAVVMLGRSLRLQEVPGQAVELSDGDKVSGWSRGYVRAAAQLGLISDDNGKGFRPTDKMTRGEMAELLAHAVGTPVDGGEQSLGSVYGNVTITQPGTVLKDTVVAGDLYITGGVGLGGVTLENTTVLGQIVVAGGGEAEDGSESVILRNVEAESLVLDSIKGKYTSLRAEGDTSVQDTTLRTGAYLQDRTEDGFGFLNLTMDGSTPAAFTLSGNLKNVVNKTPGSTLNMGAGVAKSLTMDEQAVGATLNVSDGGVIRQLNLDTAVPVTGTGDVDSVQVNTAGSSTEMLPDKISVRPGVTADIWGNEMDSVLAEESSADPRLLAGYPRMRNVGSTAATAVFCANKAGTVHWAVSALADGSISADELIEPKPNNFRVIKQGNTAIDASNTEASAAITDLTRGGTYYLSTVMTDARGTRSPVKVISFETPDDSVPAFASGYPAMVRIGKNVGQTQVRVMTTKSCNLHYVLLPGGAAAPTPNDFKTNALIGSLGNGTLEMPKNTEKFINVNSEVLDELRAYDIYFWLVDIDNGRSSDVKKLSFKTVDETPPEFITDVFMTRAQATSLTLSGAINEAGTVFWAAVKSGAQYPKAPSGQTVDYDDEAKFREFLESDYAKIQVENGGGSPIRSGKVTARENASFTFNVTGLKAENSYDIYYVAKDRAGNYSKIVKICTANTLDNLPPKATQIFDSFANDDRDTPFADTNIDIVFTENIQANSVPNGVFLDLYHKVTSAADGSADQWQAKKDLADALSATIKLFNVTGTNRATEVPQRVHSVIDGEVASTDDWVIDYYNAKVLMDDTDAEGKRVIVRFENHGTDNNGAVKLKSGSSYYFQLSGIADTTTTRNIMGTTRLPTFTTISAQAILEDLNLTDPIEYYDKTGTKKLGEVPVAEIDMAFSMYPRSASTVEENINWEMLLWSDTTASYEFFYKFPESDPNGDGKWHKADKDGLVNVPSGADFRGTNFQRGDAIDPRHGLLNKDSNWLLNTLKDDEEYQFAVRFTSLSENADRSSWSDDVNFRVQIITGTNTDLRNQTLNMSAYALDPTVTDISSPKDYNILARFSDSTPPKFANGYPIVEPVDTTATLKVNLTRPGTLYYVLAPVNAITTYDTSTPTKNLVNDKTPGVPYMENGVLTLPNGKEFEVSLPTVTNITEPKYDTSGDIIVGNPRSVGTGVVQIPLEGLRSKTTYFIYFVLEGAGGGSMSPNVLLYRFDTVAIVRPVIELDAVNNPTVNVRSNIAANTNYLLAAWDVSTLPSLLTQDFKNAIPRKTQNPTTNKDDYTIDEKYAEIWNKNYEAYLKDGYSVLDALGGDVRDGTSSLGSVFDLFASQDMKNQVANYIRAERSQSTNIAGGGSATLTANRNHAVNCAKDPFKMSKITQYAFLAVGRSTGNTSDDPNSGDAFRAIYPIFLSNEDPPLVINIIPELDVDANNRISGQVTLVFDEYLYYRDSTKTPPQTRPVDLMNTEGNATLNGMKFYPVKLLIPNLGNFEIVGLRTGETGRPGVRITSLTFEAKNAPLRGGKASIVFDAGLCNEDNKVNVSPLVIEMTKVTDEDGNVSVKVTVPKTWDGSTDKRFSNP